MPGATIPLMFSVHSIATAPPLSEMLLRPPLEPPQFVASDLVTNLVVGAGTHASPYHITPRPGTATWQCIGIDNATAQHASRCPLQGLQTRDVWPD